MIQPDIDLHSPIIPSDPNATRDLAAAFAKLSDILRDIYSNLQTIKVVESAPVATEMQELGSPDGRQNTEIIIKHHATQTSRTISYKYQGTVYTITSA